MADDLPHARVAHHLPHRLRVRVPSRKGDQAYFDRVSKRLKRERSIRSVQASRHTGSITIEYDGHAGDVALLAREEELFDLPEATVAYMLATSSAVRTTRVNPRTVVSAGLAGLGAYQLIRGNLLGSGLEHIWQANRAARTLGSFQLAGLMGLLGVIQIVRGQTLNPAASLFYYAVMVWAVNDGRPSA